MRAGVPVAYSYASREGKVGPVAGLDAEAAASALRAELARCAGRPASASLPGSARELVEVVLAAGLRLSAPPGMLLLSRSVEPPRALAISSYWLF